MHTSDPDPDPDPDSTARDGIAPDPDGIAPDPDGIAPDPDGTVSDPDGTVSDPDASEGPGADGCEIGHRSAGPVSVAGSGFDPDAARLWLWTATSAGAGPAMASALTWAVASLVAQARGDALPEVLAELVDHASEADLFGSDRRVTLWFDRDPEGRITGWHVTVELTGEALASPDGHRLRLAGTWAQAWALWSPEDDPAGVEGLVVALARVADDADDTVARSLGVLASRRHPAASGTEGGTDSPLAR